MMPKSTLQVLKTLLLVLLVKRGTLMTALITQEDKETVAMLVNKIFLIDDC